MTVKLYFSVFPSVGINQINILFATSPPPPDIVIILVECIDNLIIVLFMSAEQCCE